jgi:hypothetical protein
MDIAILATREGSKTPSPGSAAGATAESSTSKIIEESILVATLGKITTTMSVKAKLFDTASLQKNPGSRTSILCDLSSSPQPHPSSSRK